MLSVRREKGHMVCECKRDCTVQESEEQRGRLTHTDAQGVLLSRCTYAHIARLGWSCDDRGNKQNGHIAHYTHEGPQRAR